MRQGTNRGRKDDTGARLGTKGAYAKLHNGAKGNKKKGREADRRKGYKHGKNFAFVHIGKKATNRARP